MGKRKMSSPQTSLGMNKALPNAQSHFTRNIVNISPCPKTYAWGAVNRQYTPKGLRALYNGSGALHKGPSWLGALLEASPQNVRAIHDQQLIDVITSPRPKTRAWGTVNCQYLPKDLGVLPKGLRTRLEASAPS